MEKTDTLEFVEKNSLLKIVKFMELVHGDEANVCKVLGQIRVVIEHEPTIKMVFPGETDYESLEKDFDALDFDSPLCSKNRQ